MDVNLEELGCLRQQLERLELEWCTLKGAAECFAHSWPRLEVLLLGHCTIDTELGAVALQSVEELDVSNMSMAGELYECVGLFGPGCPKCTHLGFGPCLHPAESSPAASCQAFSSLQSVELLWIPVGLRSGAPGLGRA